MEQLFQTLSNKYSWETFPLWSYPKLFHYLRGDQTPAQRHDRQVLFKLGFCGCSSFFSSIFQRCGWIQISLPLSDFFLFDLERESPALSGPHAFSCATTVWWSAASAYSTLQKKTRQVKATGFYQREQLTVWRGGRQNGQKPLLWPEPLLFRSRSSFMLSNTQCTVALPKIKNITHAYTLNEFTYEK